MSNAEDENCVGPMYDPPFNSTSYESSYHAKSEGVTNSSSDDDTDDPDDIGGINYRRYVPKTKKYEPEPEEKVTAAVNGVKEELQAKYNSLATKSSEELIMKIMAIGQKHPVLYLFTLDDDNRYKCHYCNFNPATRSTPHFIGHVLYGCTGIPKDTREGFKYDLYEYQMAKDSKLDYDGSFLNSFVCGDTDVDAQASPAAQVTETASATQTTRSDQPSSSGAGVDADAELTTQQIVTRNKTTMESATEASDVQEPVVPNADDPGDDSDIEIIEVVIKKTPLKLPPPLKVFKIKQEKIENDGQSVASTSTATVAMDYDLEIKRLEVERIRASINREEKVAEYFEKAKEKLPGGVGTLVDSAMSDIVMFHHPSDDELVVL